MRFTTYTLYKQIKTYDSRGNLINEWDLIGDIDLCMSVRKLKNIEGDILYKVTDISALTPYSALDNQETYKIVDNQNKEFMITGIIFGRFNQLFLKEVITSD